MQSNEQRRVIWRHPKGIYETVEVSGVGTFGIPYRYRETVYTANRDARGVAHKELARGSAAPCQAAQALGGHGRRGAGNLRTICKADVNRNSWHRVCTAHRRLCERYSQRTM